jgi:hypothetical protein
MCLVYPIVPVSLDFLCSVLEPLGTQDTRRRQTEQRQSRETGTIGYTRHKTKTNRTVMCLVYPMVPVSLDCLCSVCLRLLSCVPNGSSFSRLSLFCLSSSQDTWRRQTEQRQSRETGTIGYTRRRQTEQRQSRDVFVLFVFDMCLVYPMVPVSLDCLCSICLRHVSCVPNGASFSRLSLETGTIGYTSHKTKTNRTKTI